jgi:hypothetical protein
VNHKQQTGNLVEIKYEANLKDKNYGLITLQPYRLYCGMESIKFLPKLALGLALLLTAFIGEIIWLSVRLYKKRANNICGKE